MDFTTSTMIVAFVALALGGFSKGVLGVGLPMVTVPIFSTFAPIPDAVAMTYIPLLTANLYQTLSGGHFTVAIRRFWPMLVATMVAIPMGVFALVRLDAGTVSILMGCAVTAFALASLISPTMRVAPRWERSASIAAGALGGFTGGMTLIGGPPVIMLLVALHLKKEEFISIIGLIYMTQLIPAGFSLAGMGVLRIEHIVPGLAALIPVGAALLAGQWVRKKIDQEHFRKVLLVSMVIIGLNLIRKAGF
jgi:uncharacterized membrane protein YfcA